MTTPAQAKAAYDAAVRKSKRPHPDATNNDGHCSVCGLAWPEDPDYLPHLCPPGFHYVSPGEGSAE